MAFKEPIVTFFDDYLEINQDFKNNGTADIKKIVTTYQMQINVDTGLDTPIATDVPDAWLDAEEGLDVETHQDYWMHQRYLTHRM